MAWKFNSNPTTVKVTKTLADTFANMESAHIDRPLSNRRMNVYKRVLENKGFRPVVWAKAYCEETKKWYRVNGKHTSTLFSSVDGTLLDGLYTVLESYHCDTLEDVAKLYATYDSNIQSRSTSEVNKSFASAVPELKDIPSKTINLLVSALNFNPNFTRGRSEVLGAYDQPADKAEVLFDNVPFCLWFHETLNQGRSSQSIKRSPVVAAIHETWKVDQEESERFWTAVKDETGESPELPDRRLAKFLIINRVDHGNRHPGPKKYQIQSREFYYKSITAWNAWRKGQRPDLKYSPKWDVPEAK